MPQVTDDKQKRRGISIVGVKGVWPVNVNQSPMKPSKHYHCVSCLRDGDTVESTHWCTDCSESLCSGCFKYHKKSKATEKHKVLPIEKVADLSPGLLNISFKCKIHPEQVLTFFCVPHDTMCCATCIPEKHQQCKELITMDNGAENVKRSKFLNDLESRIQNTRTKLSDIVKKKNENISALHNQKLRLQEEISNIRKKINEHFDKIEKHLYADLNKAHSSCIKTIENGIAQVEERINKMDVWYNDITTLKATASDIHVFTVVKTIQPLQNKQEAYLNNLQDELTKLNINFIEEEVWRHLISEVPTVGAITVSETNPVKSKEYLLFKRSEFNDKNNVGQPLVPTTRKFTFLTSKLAKGTKVRNGCFLPDNRLVLSSFHDSCVYVCNKNGDKKKKMPLSFKPYDMTLYDPQNIIFSSAKSIQAFNTDTFTFEKDISDAAGNDIISSSNNQIAVRSPSGTISVLDISGRILRRIQTQSYGSIAIDKFGRVYYSNNAKNEVHCFYPNGSHNCIYRHEDLRDPSGIATDESGNVYVAGHMSHNIHKISGQGKQQEIVLSSRDGIHYPQRITYNEKTGELLVINSEWRSIEIYQLK